MVGDCNGCDTLNEGVRASARPGGAGIDPDNQDPVVGANRGNRPRLPGYGGGIPMIPGGSYSTSSGMNESQGTSQGSSFGTSQSGTGVLAPLQGMYQQLLGVNQQRYGNVMGAYQGGQQNLSQNLPGVYGGYGALSSQVKDTLAGQGQAALTDITARNAQAVGKTTQTMTNAGLGNSTINANMQNQNAQLQSQEVGRVYEDLAKQLAGYQSNIGLAGQQAQMQGLGMQSQATNAALGPLGSQLANTFGNLTGNYSTSQQGSQNMSQQTSYGQNQGMSYNMGGNNFGAYGMNDAGGNIAQIGAMGGGGAQDANVGANAPGAGGPGFMDFGGWLGGGMGGEQPGMMGGEGMGALGGQNINLGPGFPGGAQGGQQWQF